MGSAPTGNPPSALASLEFLSVLETIRTIDPDMPIQQCATLFYVAGNESCIMQDMASALGFSQSSASRNVAALSKMHRLGKPGLDLIVAEEDPAERRRKLLSLTPKGKRVVEMVLAKFKQHASG